MMKLRRRLWSVARNGKRWAAGLMLALVIVRVTYAAGTCDYASHQARYDGAYGVDGMGSPIPYWRVQLTSGDYIDVVYNSVGYNMPAYLNGVLMPNGGDVCTCYPVLNSAPNFSWCHGTFPAQGCPCSADGVDDGGGDDGGGDGGDDDPPDCEDRGGDGDGDGCCADVDYNDGNSEICAPCDQHGGDADRDGCCADVDEDDGNPDVCQPCDDRGGDADEDGCCADEDQDDNDADAGCVTDPCGGAGDADEDGCCSDEDQDDNDPEKGCRGDDDCECEWDPMAKLEDWKEKLGGWWPDVNEVKAAAQGERADGLSGNSIAAWTLEIPWPWGDPRVLEVPIGFNIAALGHGFGAAFGWIVVYLRGLILAQIAMETALSIIRLVFFF